MGSTIIDQDYPYDILHRGAKDARRHNKRVDEAVRKQLKEIISQQDIITSDGNKKIKVRLKYLDQYRFRHSRDRVDEVGRDEFNDLEEGEIISRPEEGSDGIPNKAGDEYGDEVYEAEYSIDELTEIMMKELQLPDLDERKKNEIVAEVLEWTDIRKGSGIQSMIDKKKTLLANLKRKAKLRRLQKSVPIINDDLRYRTYNITEEKHSNAVVFLMMDRSASMWEDKIYAVKVLYFWIVQFLRRRYDNVVIKFIAHDYAARELSEEEFFTISDSGGTRVSSAYELCRDLIKFNYPADKWNIFCFHSSDGDTWGDEHQCMQLVDEITTKYDANMFAYAEINIDAWRDTASSLMEHFKELQKSNERVLRTAIHQINDVMDAIKMFLRHSVRELSK